MRNTTNTTTKINELKYKLADEWTSEVQGIADKYQVIIATGHMSDMWQVSEDGGNTWLREAGDSHAALTALRKLDKMYPPHGIGPSNLEDFHPASPYDQQATQFLTANGLKMRITLSDTKAPAWADGERHGHHYRVTLSRVVLTKDFLEPRAPSRLTFDFWGSIADADKGATPTPYDVLACISGDAYTPDTFEDFCGEYGYESDSLKALQTFRRCNAFAKRLRAFFTPSELETLSEIQ